MRESASNAATSKAVMVDEATRNTALDESEHSTFDPDSLPSVSVALKELTDTQDELRVALSKYDASLTAAGMEDDDQASGPVPSPSVSPPRRAGRRHRGRGGRATNAPRQVR